MTRLLIACTLTALSLPAAAAPAVPVRHFKGAFGRGVETAVTIHAPLATVFKILADPRPAAEFLPYVAKVTVLSEQGHRQEVRYRARQFGLFDLDYTQQRELRPPDTITFAQTQGPFKRVEGSWHLEGAGDSTRASYRVEVDPGFPVPAFLQRFYLQRGLPGLLEAIRQRAESGGAWKKG